MSLADYRAKRDFRRTGEPRGGGKAAADERNFVVQKHAARSLHYDFRLEHDGVLWSWAVPKSPGMRPGEKRLAVEVEDHPLEYGKFEGVIPKGQYGAGTVEIWDRGRWTPEGDPAAGHRQGKLDFALDGGRLHGRYTLVRTLGAAERRSAKPSWLLIKRSEASTNPEPVEAADPRTRMPATMSPMLATLVSQVPEDDDWIHEIKYDGYRMLARVDRGRARLFSRSGADWTPRLSAIARDLESLPAASAWLDGEVVVVDGQGRSRFQALQSALAEGTGAELRYLTFDLPHLDGRDLRSLPLYERQRVLDTLVGKGIGTVRVGPQVRGDGAEFRRQACAMGLEGVVSKRSGSTYATGRRSPDWVKVKCLQRQEFVIGGYTEPRGSRTGLGALLVGVYDRRALRYSGRVGTGFDEQTLRDLVRRLEPLERASSPFANPPRGAAAKGVHWVRPELVAEVSFTEWSDGGALRHPVFLGLRSDKKASAVSREKAASVAAAPRRRKAEAPTRDAGLLLTHPDKVYFPEAGISKRELVEYYIGTAEWLLPHIERRPLSLVRCPDGWSGQCFYQKHANATVHGSVGRVEVPDVKGTATYFEADSAAALAALVQWGVIELHPWGARAPRLDRPDVLIFDLDPDPKLRWEELVAGVTELRSLLGELGLTGFLKTTGGKGLHVVVPIRANLTWDEAKDFTRGVASHLARASPDRFTAALAKNRRVGRIFIDYLRNARGATAIAPYAVRARANAPVATPIAWSELSTDVRFDHFNLRNVHKRLSGRRRNPWAEYFGLRQTISASMRRRFA